MKIESYFLLGVAAFFGLIGIIYWVTSYEQAGTMMLIGSCFLGLLPGAYYLFWHRRMGNRLEDRPDATIEEGAGRVDAFPSSSIWPFVLGLGAFATVLAFAFGVWFIFPAAALIISALVGATLESRRGGTV